MKRFIPSLLLLLLILPALTANAQVQLSDSAKISLLTASPWHGAVYALFGHTAIRVYDDSTGVDMVFNYGYFDSSQPHFIYHFVRGETDYILGVTTFDEFLSEYGYKGQQVIEQELNLSPAGKQQLYEALFVNALPENRKYRYNYFYDNCATRPRDMIEKFAGGAVLYPSTPQKQTFRDLIHECVGGYPWLQFGIDLVLGSDADRIIDVREKMFIPRYLMDPFEEATIVVNDTLQLPLVKKSEMVLPLDENRNKQRGATFLNPFPTAILILLLTLFISLRQLFMLNKTKVSRLYDTFLFGIAGLGGTVIFSLLFFSAHPAMRPNWNFAWLNIFALIAAFLFWVKPAKNIVYFYHFINFVILTLFLLLWWLIPQQLPSATIPFAASLWLRSGTNLLIWRKERSNDRRFPSSSYLKAGWRQ